MPLIADDLDLADTALREAAEETGVDRGGIEVLGMLPPAHVEVSGFDVTAVIAWWREPSPVAVMDSREAASIDIVPVAVLTDPAHRARVRHPSGYTGPGVRGERTSHLGADRAPAGRRTRSCRLATALGSASDRTDSGALPHRLQARQRRTRCPLMITSLSCWPLERHPAAAARARREPDHSLQRTTSALPHHRASAPGADHDRPAR